MKNYKLFSFWVLAGLLILGLSGCKATSKPVAYGDSNPRLFGEGVHAKASKEKGRQAKKCGNTYRVKSGDTLSGIAVKCKVNMEDLAVANHIMSPYWIAAGQKLTIPTAKQAAQQKFVQKQAKTQVINQWQWPMGASIDYAYIADSEGRYAIEFYPELGRPIRSVDSGVVVYAGDAMAHYGKMLVIKHNNNYLTVYAHNRVLKVKKDQQVEAGQPIAYSGQTGETDGPKLYFEARYLGRKVDVRSLLKPPS